MVILKIKIIRIFKRLFAIFNVFFKKSLSFMKYITIRAKISRHSLKIYQFFLTDDLNHDSN